MRTTALLAVLVTVLASVGCQNSKKTRASEPSARSSSSSMAPEPAMSDFGSSPAAGSSSTAGGPQAIPVLPEPAAGTGSSAGASSGEVSGGASSGAMRGGTYTIKKGDTLTSISRQVYGTPGKVRDILAANPDIKDPNHIKVGQKLTLP